MDTIYYYDVPLNKFDLESLQRGKWLTDNIITAEMRRLEKYALDEITTVQDNTKILFFDASAVATLRDKDTSEINEEYKELKLAEKTYIFFPFINDAELGGTHWSLFVFSKPERAILHYNSSNRFGGYMNINTFEYNGFDFKPLLGAIEIGQYTGKVAPCGRQQNGNDCGIHVIHNAEQILQQIKENNRIIYHKKLPELNQIEADEKRNAIRQSIENERRKQRSAATGKPKRPALTTPGLPPKRIKSSSAATVKPKQQPASAPALPPKRT